MGHLACLGDSDPAKGDFSPKGDLCPKTQGDSISFHLAPIGGGQVPQHSLPQG